MPVSYDSPIADLGLTTQAPKTLADAGITTVQQLLAKGRNHISKLRGMGTSRLADIDAAITRHGLAWHRRADLGKWNTCKTCPTCETCGNPRAQTANAVGTGLDGRAKHLGGVVGPPCDGCDAHHRDLVADRALELAGRLA